MCCCVADGLCRENLEGEYSGLEHEVVDGVVESLKVGLVERWCFVGWKETMCALYCHT
jgi:hypothetical protein